MFFIFRDKRKQSSSIRNNVQESIAKKLEERCIRWQRKAAFKMQKGTERFSLKTKVIILILFCLLAGGYCIYILLESISDKQVILFSTTPISKPTHFQQSGEDGKASINISKTEHEKIQVFKRYMDSLARSPTGKELYDRIIYTRPHLMDSIAIIEKLYQLQTEK